MDPFRSLPPDRGELAETAAPNAEPPAAEPWMRFAHIYGRWWLGTGILLCCVLASIGTLVSLVFLMGMWAASGGDWALLLLVEAVHALVYRLVPLAAWTWARQAACEAASGADVDGWLVCGP